MTLSAKTSGADNPNFTTDGKSINFNRNRITRTWPSGQAGLNQILTTSKQRLWVCVKKLNKICPIECEIRSFGSTPGFSHFEINLVRGQPNQLFKSLLMCCLVGLFWPLTSSDYRTRFPGIMFFVD